MTKIEKIGDSFKLTHNKEDILIEENSIFSVQEMEDQKLFISFRHKERVVKKVISYSTKEERDSDLNLLQNTIYDL